MLGVKMADMVFGIHSNVAGSDDNDFTAGPWISKTDIDSDSIGTLARCSSKDS